MNAVGFVSIVVGAIFLVSRVSALVAPGKMLTWFRTIIRTNRGVRTVGAPILVLGLTMIGVGYPQDSGLATVLFYVGIIFVGMSTFLLLLFPGIYRSMVESMMPEDTEGVMIFIRYKGLSGIVIGGLFIYFGALAL
ncbi:hypothetical protein JYT90_00995 [bacterium AH-315-P07]|nr:hypothetical protein [bacterium AH-315-P07]